MSLVDTERILVVPTELLHRKNQYAATGASYMACYEFGERTRGVSYLHYGQSHDPKCRNS